MMFIREILWKVGFGVGSWKLEWGMGNGEWGMGNGEWGMGNGEMGNGEWGMGNGEWRMERCDGDGDVDDRGCS